METDKKLNKDAKPGEMTMRGTVVPDVTGNLRLGHAFDSAGESLVCRVRDQLTGAALPTAGLGALMGIEDQPPPVPNDRPAIADLVIADMVERKAIGIERYGTPLQPFNGRDPLVDAYQEALDLVVYLRQAIEERPFVTATLYPSASLTANDDGTMTVTPG